MNQASATRWNPVGLVLFWLVAMLLLAICTEGYLFPESAPAAEAQRQKELDQQAGQKLAAGLQYFYDEKSGLCFAHRWGGSLQYGGPAMALVPYEKVKHLLLNPPAKDPPTDR